MANDKRVEGLIPVKDTSHENEVEIKRQPRDCTGDDRGERYFVTPLCATRDTTGAVWGVEP